MNWLEIVNIRTAGKTEFIKALACCGHLQQDLEAGGAVCVHVYRNTIYATDLSIHLFWDSASSNPAKTSVGIQLSKSFSRFGLIDHKVLQPALMNKDRVDS
jgi:hypothetical protein